MSTFTLNERLAADCHQLGRLNGQHLLLMNNQHIPWFILVPETDQRELCDLPASEQATVLDNINWLSAFLRAHFTTDKLNIGIIGNMVSQLHIHVAARQKDDIYWPGVIWNRGEAPAYTPQQVEEILQQLKAQGPAFSA